MILVRTYRFSVMMEVMRVTYIDSIVVIDTHPHAVRFSESHNNLSLILHGSVTILSNRYLQTLKIQTNRIVCQMSDRAIQQVLGAIMYGTVSMVMMSSFVGDNRLLLFIVINRNTFVSISKPVNQSVFRQVKQMMELLTVLVRSMSVISVADTIQTILYGGIVAEMPTIAYL